MVKTRAAAQSGVSRAELASNGAGPAVPPSDSAGLFDVVDLGNMVGRQAELSRLRSIWHTAAGGSTRLALVAGDAGVGKTRLAAELAGIVETSGGKVLVGRCAPGGDRAFEPFVQAVGPALAERSDAWLRAHVKRHGGGILRLFPELAPRLPDSGPDVKRSARPQLIGALAAAISGGKEPVLLVVEDLHWASRSTVLVLDHIARHRAPGPVLVVGTYRDAAIHPSHPLAELLHGHGPGTRRIDQIVLGNLSPQAVTALLVDRAAVAGRAASGLARSLWLRTEGNPLLLTEALRDVIAGGGLAPGVVNGDAVDRIGVPHEVAALVMRRLGRPTGSARRAVEMASVLGRSFSVEAVAAAAEMEDKTVRTGLAKAAAARIVLVEPAGAGQPDRYRFAHECFRDAVYECLTPSRRVRAHRAVADVLRRPDWFEPVPASVVLHHLAAATPVGQAPFAAEQAQRAGEAAMEVLAFEEAAGFYGQALAFLGSGAAPGRRADLLLLLADAHHQSGESARARQSYLQAGALARAAKDGPRLGRAVLGLGDVLGVWGADGVLIGLLEEAIEASPDDASLKAKLLARLAQARAALDSPDERKQQSDRAWELAWDSRDPDTMNAVLRARHEALSAPDDLEDRVEMDGELFAMATNAKDAGLAILAHGWRLLDLLEQGHLVDAERDRKAHAQLARRSGDPRHERDAAVWAATWALLVGKNRKAATQIDRALGLGQQARDPQASAIYWQQQLGLVLEWGSDAEAEGLIEVWRDLVRTHDRAPAWRAPLALLLATFGHQDEAGVELDGLLSEECADLPLDRTWLPTVAAIGEVAAMLEDPRCEFIGKLLWLYGRRLIVHGAGLACRGSVSRVLGLLSATRGDWLAAERQFQSAVSAHERIDAGPLLARTRSQFGQALARKPGGPLHMGRARQMLDQAREEARAFGMQRLAAETQAARKLLA